MARKKVALAYIRNDASRKASLKKRKRGLINKVREISTLCAVDACVVIYTPHNRVPEVWPSLEQARVVLTHYLAVLEIDRYDKELDPESFMLKRLRKKREKLERIRRENKRKHLEWFMYRCMAGRDNMDCFDMRDRAEMGWVINQVMRDIRSRMEKFMVSGGGDGQDASTSAAAVMAPPPVVVEEECVNSSLMDLLLSPPEEESTWLDWDIGSLSYPHLFNESGSEM
ncbi:agamous-like mads-box protein agl80 [Phtheirospermum japonicum]|uniref:Agamous-like mads-box protein agl80 n=1 Tax=Phtheirospermum japonicum TaxID=374723 RepID=A0A830CYZ0_9LAMI|nr:agamous-like mads-box protein agl80 [Phtheirospermum japonicum]